jgi:hypothetical protein
MLRDNGFENEIQFGGIEGWVEGGQELTQLSE